MGKIVFLDMALKRNGVVVGVAGAYSTVMWSSRVCGGRGLDDSR